MIRTTLFLAALLVVVSLLARYADPLAAAEPPAENGHAATPKELERKLLGEWMGGACMGDYTLLPDGTFEMTHFSPGNNTLSGTWSVKWDSLPPVMAFHCKTSDDADYTGKAWEVKLVQLDDKVMHHQSANQTHVMRWERPTEDNGGRDRLSEKELAALQGTWVALQYEEGGKLAPGPLDTRHIIKGNKVTVIVAGQPAGEGTVELDPTQNPKRLELRMANGQTHLIAYVRVGNQVIYCGNRDGKTRPTEISSGTAKGGDYLMAWRIER